MPATYPGTRRVFPTHVNTTEVVDATHVNDLQDEVTAIQLYLGLNPHVSTAGGGSSLGAWAGTSRTYASLADRIANLEAGHTADTHTQYVRFTGTETVTGSKTFSADTTTFGAATAGKNATLTVQGGASGGGSAVLKWVTDGADRFQLYKLQGDANLYLRDLVNARMQETYTPGATALAALTQIHSRLTVDSNTVLSGTLGVTGATTLAATTATTLALSGALTLAAGTGATPAASAVGDTALGGTSTDVARADHRHAREVFSATAPVVVTAAGTSAVGTSVSPARSDHAHGLASGVPGTSAVGASAAEGSSTAVARVDHVHGREAFATAITASTVGAGAVGTAVTVPRGDHAHPLSSAAPTTSAVGAVAAEGTATTVSRSDHVHGREAFGAAPPAVNVTAGNTGAATTLARSDHNHSVTVGSPVAETSFGGTTSDGTSTALARADHRHGTPAAPTPASVGAVNKAGDTMTGALTVPSPLTVGDGTLTKTAGNPFTFNSGVSATTVTASSTVTGTTGVFDGTQRVYSLNNPPPIAAPVVIMPFYIGGAVGTGLRRPKFLATVPMTIRGARSLADVGSGTYEVYVNGANISGAATTFDTTQRLHDFTDVNINAGDRVQINIATASTDASDLSVTLDVVTR